MCRAFRCADLLFLGASLLANRMSARITSRAKSFASKLAPTRYTWARVGPHPNPLPGGRGGRLVSSETLSFPAARIAPSPFRERAGERACPGTIFRVGADLVRESSRQVGVSGGRGYRGEAPLLREPRRRSAFTHHRKQHRPGRAGRCSQTMKTQPACANGCASYSLRTS